jgi:hypothetical protein
MGYTVSWEPLRFTNFTYQNVISTIPKVLSPGIKFTEDENGFTIGVNDNDCVYFARTVTEEASAMSCWAKTNRLPYTKDVMKAMILMVEYGVTENLSHDDTDMSWFLEALEDVDAKHSLTSYKWQKMYFTELGRVKSGTKQD